MYLRKTRNKLTKAKVMAGRLVATRAGGARVAPIRVAAPPDDMVGVGARKKAPKKTNGVAGATVDAVPNPDLNQAVLDALTALQGNTEHILQRVQALEQNAGANVDGPGNRATDTAEPP